MPVPYRGPGASANDTGRFPDGPKSLLLRLTPGGTASEFWNNGDIPFVLFAVPDDDPVFKRASFTPHTVYPFPTVENVFHRDAR
jgi:hypothetical protein